MAMLVLRVVLGLVFVTHGYLKLFGRSFGPARFADYLRREGMPAPTALAYGIGVLELATGLCLLTGLRVPIAGGLLAVHVLLALVTVGPSKGFTRLPDQAGFEYELVLLASLLALIFAGPPPYSLDGYLAR